MFTQNWKACLLTVFAISITGCSALVNPFGDEAQVSTNMDYDPAKSQRLASDKGLQYRAESIKGIRSGEATMPMRPVRSHKKIGDYASQLAMHLMEHAFTLKQRDRIAIASFVRFNKTLREPTVIGNKMAESLIAELQQYGMTIIDTKLATDYAITQYGDLALSRDVDNLSSELGVDYILTGTLMERASGIEVNARIISVDTQHIAAAATVTIPQFIVAAEQPLSFSD